MKHYQLSIDINTTIELLNIICIVNQEQYLKIFTSPDKTDKLLSFMASVFQIPKLYADYNIQVPSVLKAALIKTYGYLIQHEKGKSRFTTNKYVCNDILEICLSPFVLQDTNINVFIRNSWTISFICNLYPIEDIIKSKFNNLPNETEMTNLELMIDACSKYAELQASNKEKVAASSIRALGFVV